MQRFFKKKQKKNTQVKSLAVEVLEDFGYFQPVPEAGQALISDLLPALVRDHLAILLHDHKLGHGCDVVPFLQLAEIKKKDKQKEHVERKMSPGFTALWKCKKIDHTDRPYL